jgi:hypothetical protein
MGSSARAVVVIPAAIVLTRALTVGQSRRGWRWRFIAGAWRNARTGTGGDVVRTTINSKNV